MNRRQRSHPPAADDRSAALESVGGQNLLGDLRIRELRGTARKLAARAIRQPAVVAEESVKLLAELAQIVRGQADAQPPSGDKRFADLAWSGNGFYRRLRQGHQAFSQALQNYADRSGLEGKEAGRARFLMSQVSDALAPTNFLLGNPAALKRALDTGGKSLLDGGRNFLQDARARRPVPLQVDSRPFKVGDNLAATPGDVVLRTPMFELLQYAPQTSQVHQRPILVIMSIINKYYAFDLAPGRSLIEHLVKQGLSVFAMVWRNPRPEDDGWGMDAYMEAMDEALRSVQSISKVKDPNVLGVCGAAPLVVTLAGHYAARRERKIGSLTLFVAPLDMKAMSEAPLIGDFMDPKLTRMAQRLPKKSDRISAKEFTLLFAMLRPNDLIWNYWVNNYLMGEAPPAFDVLAWNADATGMTARFNLDFGEFCESNPLVTPHAMSFRGAPIADVASFDFDSYIIGARTDHICPWPTVYRSAQMLGERCRFVLGGSGHIQTIVATPGNPKNFYYLNPDMSKDAEGWLAAAEKVQGTWWDHYVAWCRERSGPLVAAPRKPGNKQHPSLGKAPGTYVHEQAT
ncbi:MAG TPA: alpha/beta fold hydrolase [Rubrivivax sp.]|nr:alpha/beta fold hydrolase [Rubrivivax sp.]